MSWFLNNARGDRWIWLVVILLSMLSVLAVYSSTGTLAYQKGADTTYYLLKHGVMIIAGLVLMYLAHLIDYRYYKGISRILLIISLPILAYTLFFGSEINDAKRWITLPIINQTFQPSDFAKLALFMFLARELSNRQENIKDFWKGFSGVFWAVILVFALIAPANMSTALMVFMTCLILMFVGRISIKQISLVALVGIVLMAAFAFFGPRKETYKSRINAYINAEQVDSDKSYQSDQAKIAIATGGLTGKGPGNSTQRNFLPSPYADFIYAIIIEEYGLIGAILIVVLYLIFLYRSVKIITKAPKAFGALLATALSFSLVIQAFANMGVAVNLLPVTGAALPLVSMGGTSILFTSVAFGIILSVSRDIEETEKGARGEIA